MRAVDMMLSIPPILLAIITVAVLGPGLHQPGPGSRLHPLAALHARRLRPDPRGLHAAVHHRLPPRRRAERAPALPPRAAEHPRAARGGRHARVRPDGALRGRALLPRPRHPAADAELGRDHGASGATTSPRRGGSPPCPVSACSCWSWRSTCWAISSATASTRGRAGAVSEDERVRSVRRQAGRGDRRRRDLRTADRRTPSRAPERGSACPTPAPEVLDRLPGELGVTPGHDAPPRHRAARGRFDPRPGPARRARVGRARHPDQQCRRLSAGPAARHPGRRVGPDHGREPARAVSPDPRDGPLDDPGGRPGLHRQHHVGRGAECGRARCPTARRRRRSSD